MRALFEDVHWTGHESFLVRAFDLPRFTVPWHFHPEVELTLILEGSGDRCVGDHLEPFQAGDLVLLGAHLPHYWHSHGHASAGAVGSRVQERARAIVVHWREDRFGTSVLGLPEAATWKKLVEKARRGLCFEGPTGARAAKELQALTKLKGSQQLLGLLRVLQTMAEGAESARALAGEHYLPSTDQHAADRVRRVYEFLYAKLAEPIGLEDMAKVAGMSDAAFCRYWKRVTGRTPTRLVGELRITQACKMLTDTDLSVSEIAYACGFQSISNFNRVFQQIKETSPLAYRRLRVPTA